MATKIRGITIELSADATGVSNGLKQVNSSISSTGRELKDINKLLKLDPTNVTLLAQKHETLQRQVENTKEKLELLKKAEEDLKAQMVDGGTEEQKRQLEALQREIIATEKDVDKYTKELDECEKETGELAKSEEKATQATQKMSIGYDALKLALASLIKEGLQKAAQELKELIKDGPAYADEILTMASTTSMATDKLQELSYMSDLVDVDVNTVAKSMQKLTKNMSSAAKGSGETYDAFESIGVSIVDMNGHLRDNEDVFYDVIEALGKMENETERDAVSMKIFGKSATELNPMIEAGSKKLREFSKEAHDMGYVLDEDALEALGRVQDEFDRFDRQVVAVKNRIAAGLAPAIERGMKKINTSIKNVDWEKWGKRAGDALDKVIDVFEWIINHGNGVKAILTGIVTAMAAQKVATFVSGLLSLTSALKAATVAQEGMNAAANANPYVLLATAIVALTAAAISYGSEIAKARWESSELGKEIIALQEEMEEMTLATDEAVNTYREMEETRTASISSAQAEAGHLQALSDELKTLVDENGNVNEADKARAEFILNELNGALGTEYELNNLLNGKYQEITSSINTMIEAKRAEVIMAAQEEAYATAVTGLSDAEELLAQNVQTRIEKENEIAEIEAELQALQAKGLQETTAADEELIESKRILKDQLISDLEQLEGEYYDLADTVDGYVYDIQQYESNWEKTHAQDYSAIDTKSWETAKSMGEASNAYSTAVATATVKSTNSWMSMLAEQLSQASGSKVEFRDAGNGMVQALVDGQKLGEPMTVKQVEGMNKQMKNKLNEAYNMMKASGAEIPNGVAKGVYSGSGSAYTAVASLAQNMIATFKSNMKINSPSKIFEDLTGFMVDGVPSGIEKNEKKALKSVKGFAGDIEAEMSTNLSMFSKDGGYRGFASGYGSVSTANSRGVQSDSRIVGLLQRYLPELANAKLVIDGKATVGTLITEIDSQLGRLQRSEVRGV